ncbi:hypothetical protein EBU94_02390 [bacterium]|nr:hypothetical protein [bacterium]
MASGACGIDNEKLQMNKYMELVKLFTKNSPIFGVGYNTKPRINNVSIYKDHPNFIEYRKKILQIDNNCVIEEHTRYKPLSITQNNYESDDDCGIHHMMIIDDEW